MKERGLKPETSTGSCPLEGMHSWDPSNPCRQGKTDVKTMTVMMIVPKPILSVFSSRYSPSIAATYAPSLVRIEHRKAFGRLVKVLQFMPSRLKGTYLLAKSS